MFKNWEIISATPQKFTILRLLFIKNNLCLHTDNFSSSVYCQHYCLAPATKSAKLKFKIKSDERIRNYHLAVAINKINKFRYRTKDRVF